MNDFMKAAVDEARKGLAEGGIPIGAVLVKDGEIISRGHNRRVQDGDPLAHAEIVCMRNAGRKASFEGAQLYCTLMPCYLCAGAIVTFGISKCIVGERRNYQGDVKFLTDHGTEFIDLDFALCYEMMSGWIAKNPGLWKEDSGKRYSV
ncbi:nucleoside deaminase [bacterium]|nr:nucleoside deaminase [Candidatus Omnitrophota bacterium]MBU3930678.1 nucleoside deaminase [bacterium]MBU4122156.1 nucleoside deaminase [bacterium]